MKFIQTFWTKPLLNDKGKIYKNIKMYEVSSFLIKKYFPEIELELVTDSYGKECLTNCAYDRYRLFFDHTFFENFDIFFWSIPKLLSFAKYNEPFIHFDGDFFINSKNILQNVNTNNFDIIAQNREVGDIFEDVYKPQINLIYQIINKKKPLENYAYSCGIIGFNNMNAKNKYLNHIIDLLSGIIPVKNVIENNLKYNLFNTGPEGGKQICCLIEQHLLAVVAARYNFHVKEIFNLNDILIRKNCQFTFDNLKFIHPVGELKYSDIFIKKLEDFLNISKLDSTLNICDFFSKDLEFQKQLYLSESQGFISEIDKNRKKNFIDFNIEFKKWVDTQEK